jgi:hypothetical protein
MTRTASARGQDGQKEAAHTVKLKLFTECDAVPCPSCGRYQERMIPQAKWERKRWLLESILYLILIAGIAAGGVQIVGNVVHFSEAREPAWVAPAFWSSLAAGAVGAVALPAYWYVSSLRYDPNLEDVEARRRLGQQRVISISKEAYGAYLEKPSVITTYCFRGSSLVWHSQNPGSE